MALETGNYINDLVNTNPTGADPKSAGDDHLRLVKKVIQQSISGFPGAVLFTGTDTGAANAYVIAPTIPLVGYTTPSFFLVKVANANTGACTLNVSALGARSIKTLAGADPSAGDVNGWCLFVFDGTNMVLLAGSAFIPRTGNSTLTGNLTLTGNETISGTLGVTGNTTLSGTLASGALTVTGAGSFTDVVTGITAAAADSTTKFATTQFVGQAIAAASQPSAIDVAWLQYGINTGMRAAAYSS